MDFPDLFSRAAVINLPRRTDRRDRMAERLSAVHIPAEFFPAVDARSFTKPRGYHATPQRAVSLSFRFLLREAERRKFPSLLVFEDDCVFHPHFRELVAALEVPDDWQLFYFGALHIEPPAPVSPGVVRVSRAFDMHAVAFRSTAFRIARDKMRGRGKGQGRGDFFNDVLLADLHKELPTYAAFPNLAWQEVGDSDIAHRRYSNYDGNGAQVFCKNAVAHVAA